MPVLERATYVIFPDKAQGKASFFWHLTMQIHSCYIIPHLHPSLSPLPPPPLSPSTLPHLSLFLQNRLVVADSKSRANKVAWKKKKNHLNGNTEGILNKEPNLFYSVLFQLRPFSKQMRRSNGKLVNAKGCGKCELCRVQPRWIWAPPNNSLTQEISICVSGYCSFFFFL